jgi:hypothetical protein
MAIPPEKDVMMSHRSRWLISFVLLLSPPAMAVEPVAAATSYSRAEVRAELNTLYRELQAAHFDLFARRERADYDRLHRRLGAGLPATLSRAATETLLRRFVAYGRIAHARIDFPAADWDAFRRGGGKAFPLALRVVDGSVRVQQDYTGLDTIDVGDRIDRIDGKRALDWLQRLRVHLAADNDYMAHTMMEPMLPMLVWLQHGEVEECPARDDEPAWDRREARMLDDGIAYLRPGPFYNTAPDATDVWDASAFRAFIDGAFRDFIAADADSLLIDLRDNPGGDNSFSDPMLAWFATREFRFCSTFRVRSSVAARASNRARLDAAPTSADSVTARYEAAYAANPPGTVFDFEIAPTAPRRGERYAGRVFLLLNRHSYSNTVLVAALAQDYGFATILGEETSDLASTYGAMETFTLPRTGIVVGFPKARIVRPSGQADARGVIPDVAIATPIQDSDDSVLARALEIVRGAPQPTSTVPR